MDNFWAREINKPGHPGSDYWTFFAERLVCLAGIPEAAAVLDIGTYDGNVLFKAMQKLVAPGYGVGIDIDRDDFHAGMSEAKEKGWGNRVFFTQMDADWLGFQSNTFDAVLANFVGWDCFFDFERMVYILPDRRTPDIMRVLKAGGQVGIGTWIEQGDIDWFTEAFHKYFPGYDQNLFCYGRENPEGYQWMLKNSGFENVHTQVETNRFASPDAETWWRQIRQAAQTYFKQVSDPVKLERFKDQVLIDLEEFRYPEGICFNKTVAYTFGHKPA